MPVYTLPELPYEYSALAPVISQGVEQSPTRRAH